MYLNKKMLSLSIVPPFNHGEGTTDMLSSSLIGNGVIVMPSISNDLSQARTYGSLSLTILCKTKDGKLMVGCQVRVISM
jgi:hypothetical protein